MLGGFRSLDSAAQAITGEAKIKGIGRTDLMKAQVNV